MDWTGKSRTGGAAAAATKKKIETSAPIGASGHRASETVRISNGLKEFLWLTSDVQHGRLLDLGPVCQSTINFFIELGFRVTTGDILRSWSEFQNAEAERKRKIPPGEDEEEPSEAERAKHFLEYAMDFRADDFHAVLAWDVFDYLEADVMPRVAERLYELVHPGGVVLAMFHSKPPGLAHRYRIVDHENIEMLPAKSMGAHRRIFQNREILNLFGRFRSTKSFVGRDQLREGLFIK